MSSLTPKFIGPDGVAREQFIFSTTLPERFFQGLIDASTIDLQISIRGGEFVSNPDLIYFEGTTFIVPNPSVYPDGLDLQAGSNEILVRAISTSGAVSNPARIEVSLIQEADLDLFPDPPSNLKVERFNDEVEIVVEKPAGLQIVGMNFYASQFSGGGASGYSRINLNPVTDSFLDERTSELQRLEFDNDIATNPDGSPAADPLYLQLQQRQTRGGDVIEHLEDVSLTPQLAEAITYSEQDNLLVTDFTTVKEVPETVARIRTSVVLESVVQTEFVRFRHNRNNGPTSTPPTVPSGAFAATPLSDPLYYVATVVVYDETAGIERESPFSTEVFGNPVTVSLTLGSYPVVTRSSITTQLISSVLRSHPEINLSPGAVIRDTVVDPTAKEIEKVRFITDFLHRSQSFDTLLQIDGVDPNGNPVPVQSSAYKQALQQAFSISASQTQALIDQAFELLASKVGETRLSGKRARGLVTFFTRRRPTTTIPIPTGTRVAAGGTFFVTTKEESIPVENAASFFDPITGLFSVDVPVQAEQPGSQGVVGPGQINTVIGISGLGVTNASATFGGDNLETNYRLAIRAKNALASVDSGTEAGYRNTLARVPGVTEAIVVTPGSDLMQRDYDSDYEKHVGGKVDIWTRGDNLAPVTDSFAFQYQQKFNVQFAPIGNVEDLRFRALDESLSENNPLAEMLDYPNVGLGLRNASTGLEFDLTGVVIEDFRTIKLNIDVPQPLVTFGDVVLGDYRLVTSREFVLPRQPVREILSVTGAISGILPATSYELVSLDDPLKEGRSIHAQSYLRIFDVNGNPSGQLIEVVGEAHVVIGDYPEFLNNLGANTLSIRVFNEERTIEYRGPFDPSGLSDFTIVPGNAITAASIKRTSGGNITSGQRISVDYSHDENFSVRYSTNLTVSVAQEDVNKKKHADADALVKEEVAVPVDITATIAKKVGSPKSTVDRRIRSNLSEFFSNLPSGSSISQSDIIGEIERADGVNFVVVPLTKLARSANAMVIREELLSSQPGDSTQIRGTTFVPISTGQVLVWLLNQELNSATTNAGGPSNVFRGVFQDDLELELQSVEPLALGRGPNRAYIIGNDGLSIPGFSDDLTLQSLFPTATNEEIRQERRKRTANRVMLSLPVGDSPTNHSYRVTYVVGSSNEGAKDISAFQIEYFTVGNLNFTYTEV